MVNKVLFVLAIAIVVIVGVFIWQTKPAQPNSNTDDWQAYTDSKLGASFKYPATLGTTYITAQTWPPTVKLVAGPLVCAVEPQVHNGRSYCAKAETDGAAGSVYTTYTYSSAIPKSDKVIDLTFTLRSVQCANFDEPKKSACDSERTLFNVDKLAYDMLDTISLSR